MVECSLEKAQKIKSKIDGNLNIEKLSKFLKVLCDTTRLKIVLCLLEESCCQTEITNAVGISKSLASHQLKILINHNIVRSNKQGRHVVYSIYDNHVNEVVFILFEHLNEGEK